MKAAEKTQRRIQKRSEMAITLNLAPEQEAQVRRKALAQGRRAENYAAELVMRDITVPADEPAAPSLAESLEGLIGVLSSADRNNGRSSHIAENAGAEFTRALGEKHEAGQP